MRKIKVHPTATLTVPEAANKAARTNAADKAQTTIKISMAKQAETNSVTILLKTVSNSP